MKKGIIGKKIGMTQIFDEVGNVIPVTVIQAGPCVVAQRKTADKDGYEAVQLGFMDAKAKQTTKAEAGHFEKNGLAVKKHLKEFRLDDCSAYSVGDVVSVETFAVGDKVVLFVDLDYVQIKDGDLFVTVLACHLLVLEHAGRAGVSAH